MCHEKEGKINVSGPGGVNSRIFCAHIPIATCENQPDVIKGGLIPILRMEARRLPARVRT